MKSKRLFDASDKIAVFYSESGNHHSVRATRAISPGETVHTFSAKEVIEHPTYLSLQVGEDKHITLSPESLQYINHSCEPNVFFDIEKMEITAIAEIRESDEVVFFYPSTEWSMAQPFECFCKSARCLGVIRGAVILGQDSFARYRFAEHIKNHSRRASSHYPR